MDVERDALIRSAIAQRRLIRLRYLNKERILEPHDYGIHKRIVKLLAFQVGGFSSGRLPNWRWLEVDKIADIILMDKPFAGGRAAPSMKHHEWDEVFIRVVPANGVNSL